MQTEEELNVSIIRMTMAIAENYPELSKFIIEMPVTIPSKANPEITLKVLQNYLDSLHALFWKYIASHNIKLL